MKYRLKFSELVYASIALSFLVGAVIAKTQFALNVPKMLLVSAAIVWLAYLVLSGAPKKKAAPKFVPEAPADSMPRYESRRWARAIYHNGYITLAELQAFYATHPERMDDPDR